PDPPLAPTPHTLADAHAYTFTDGATHHGADRARVAQRGRRGGDTGSAAERRGARAPDRRRRRGRGRRARRAGVRARAALLALDTENRVVKPSAGWMAAGLISVALLALPPAAHAAIATIEVKDFAF